MWSDLDSASLFLHKNSFDMAMSFERDLRNISIIILSVKRLILNPGCESVAERVSTYQDALSCISYLADCRPQATRFILHKPSSSSLWCLVSSSLLYPLFLSPPYSSSYTSVTNSTLYLFPHLCRALSLPLMSPDSDGLDN